MYLLEIVNLTLLLKFKAMEHILTELQILLCSILMCANVSDVYKKISIDEQLKNRGSKLITAGIRQIALKGYSL